MKKNSAVVTRTSLTNEDTNPKMERGCETNEREVLSFSDFCEEVRIGMSNTEEFAGHEFSLCKVTKNNGQEFTGIRLTEPEGNICPTIYMESDYDSYVKGNTDVKSICERVARLYKKSLSEGPDEGILSILTDWEKAKERVFPRAISRVGNEDFVLDKPHRCVEDLEILYAISLPNFGEDGASNGTVTITNSLAESLGVGEEDLFEVATANMLSDLEVKPMSVVLAELVGASEEELPFEAGAPEMLVATNKQKLWGAGLLASDACLKAIAEKMGGDYIILPSSVHEVICVPADSGDVETFRGMICSVNAECVEAAEVLGNHPYLYEAATHTLKGVGVPTADEAVA